MSSKVYDLPLGNAKNWNGFLTEKSNSFDENVANLNSRVEEALIELQKDPSNPLYLSTYQQALSEYTLYRNAQSNITKTYKDVSSAIIANFR